tara:strand:- start:238 stop:516 length:279 start_codon:yes stop_codon:yes gene_type:complete
MNKQKGLGLKVVEDNVEKSNPNLPRDIKIAVELSKDLGQCTMCSETVETANFDLEDLAEYKISGMCKSCQDKVFKSPESMVAYMTTPDEVSQ